MKDDEPNLTDIDRIASDLIHKLAWLQSSIDDLKKAKDLYRTLVSDNDHLGKAKLYFEGFEGTGKTIDIEPQFRDNVMAMARQVAVTRVREAYQKVEHHLNVVNDYFGEPPVKLPSINIKDE